MLFLIPLIAFLGIILHLSTTAMVGSMLGGVVEEIHFGFGPHWRLWATPPIRLGCFPVGGWLRFVGAVENPEHPPSPGDFLALSRPRRGLTLLSGPLFVWAVAAIVLGPLPALESAARVPMQLMRAYDPSLLRDHYQFLCTLAPLPLIGCLFTKLAAFNLLPLPTLAGGDALLTLLGVSNRSREWLTLLTMPLFAIGFVVLLISVIRAVLMGIGT